MAAKSVASVSEEKKKAFDEEMAIKETAAANKKETEDWDAIVRQRKMIEGV
mgnify:CR=1 FL=1